MEDIGGQTQPLWDEWVQYNWQFESSRATVQIVGSDKARQALDDLYSWFTANVLRATPFEPNLDQAGEHAKHGPRMVAEEATVRVAAFANAVSADA